MSQSLSSWMPRANYQSPTFNYVQETDSVRRHFSASQDDVRQRIETGRPLGLHMARR